MERERLDVRRDGVTPEVGDTLTSLSVLFLVIELVILPRLKRSSTF